MIQHLDWEGSWNARDLGGLATTEGGRTHSGAVVRSESPHQLTPQGWFQLEAHGIRTIIDMRDPDQRQAAPYTAPASVQVWPIPMEDGLQKEPLFLSFQPNGWLSTALYFHPFLKQWPERCTRLLEAVAAAPPGGVLVHCQKGSDRTGLLALALLVNARVEPESIVADYLATATRLASPRALSLGWKDETEFINAVYEREQTTPQQSLRSTIDLLKTLLLVSESTSKTLRQRLVKP